MHLWRNEDNFKGPTVLGKLHVSLFGICCYLWLVLLCPWEYHSWIWTSVVTCSVRYVCTRRKKTDQTSFVVKQENFIKAEQKGNAIITL